VQHSYTVWHNQRKVHYYQCIQQYNIAQWTNAHCNSTLWATTYHADFIFWITLIHLIDFNNPFIIVFLSVVAVILIYCHIKRDHPVHTICSKCPPLAKMHAGIFWHFPRKPLGIFNPNFTCLLYIPIYARLKKFIQLSPTLTKLRHIKCEHPACV